VSSLSKTVTRQRRDCDMNPGLLRLSTQYSTLTTRLPSHPHIIKRALLRANCKECLIAWLYLAQGVTDRYWER